MEMAISKTELNFIVLRLSSKLSSVKCRKKIVK